VNSSRKPGGGKGGERFLRQHTHTVLLDLPTAESSAHLGTPFGNGNAASGRADSPSEATVSSGKGVATMKRPLEAEFDSRSASRWPDGVDKRLRSDACDSRGGTKTAPRRRGSGRTRKRWVSLT
jgi:hypothetical protein